MNSREPEVSLTPDQRAELLKRAWELLNTKDYREVVALLELLPKAELLEEPELGFCLCASFFRMDRHIRALQLLDQVTSVVQSDSHSLLERQCYHLQSVLLIMLGRLEEADGILDRLRDRAIETNDEYHLGVAYHVSGLGFSIRAQQAEALSSLSRALSVLSGTGRQQAIATVHQCAAVAFRDLEVYDQAHAHFDHADRIFAQHGSVNDRMETASERALLLCRTGDLRLAEATARFAIARAEEAELPRSIAESRRVLGIIAFARGDWAEAREQLSAALEGSRATSNPLLQAEVLEELAVLEQAEGNEPRAEEALEQSCEIYERMGAPLRAQRARARLAPAAVANGDETGNPLFD